MRPRIFALLVGVLVGVLVLGAAPAHAVPPPPPPVTPASGLPSWSGVYYNPEGLTPGSPAYDDWLARMRSKVPPPVNSLMPSNTAPAVKPITAPAALSRGATGGLLGLGYAVGWGVGTAGLAAYGQATGTDFNEQMCDYSDNGTAERFLVDVHRGLNFQFSNDCQIVPNVVNADMPMGGTSPDGTFAYRIVTGSDAYGPWVGVCGPSSYSGASSLWVNTYGGSPPSWSGWGNVSYSTVTECGSPAYWGSARPANGPWRLVWQVGGVVTVLTPTASDPLRTPSCDIDWEDGSTTSGTGIDYRETYGITFSSEATGCAGAWSAKNGSGGPTFMPSRIRVKSSAPSPTGGAPTVTTISDQTVPTPTTDQRTALSAPVGAQLILTKTVAGVTDSCMTWAADCSGWWAATSAGTAPSTGTTTYTCTFGGVAVSLAECGVYRQTFDVKTANPVVTDPVTGDEVAWVPGTASSSPGNSGDPGTMPSGSSDPHGDCMAEWPSAPDPVSWVLHPVKCALVWAFVPREAEVTRLTGELTDMWEATGVGLTINTISAWQFVAPENGCGGVLVPMSTMFGHGIEDFYLLDACPGSPLEATAQWCFWIVLIASVINVIKSVTRNIGSIVGAKGVAEGDE